jgi:hypothetical protein
MTREPRIRNPDDPELVRSLLPAIFTMSGFPGLVPTLTTTSTLISHRQPIRNGAAPRVFYNGIDFNINSLLEFNVALGLV